MLSGGTRISPFARLPGSCHVSRAKHHAGRNGRQIFGQGGQEFPGKYQKNHFISVI
jgi:hypothetical protein